MKTLSVRFYKRLILLILALLIIIPTVLAVFFGMQNARLRGQLAGKEPGPVHSGSPLGLEAETIPYQELYPELYSGVSIASKRLRETNMVYLTFDSTPGDNTEAILNVLADYGVKATFFLTGAAGEESLALMKTIVDRGHVIGLRGYSDSYQQIYSSVKDFLADFKTIYDQVYEATGVQAEIFRYPGGSINAYNSGIYQELNAEMLRRGFVFFDWDVSGEDTAIGGLSSDQIQNNVLAGMEGKDRGIVMLRDAAGKEAVSAALPGIIAELQSRGYGFQTLSPEVLPVVFSYKGAP